MSFASKMAELSLKSEKTMAEESSSHAERMEKIKDEKFKELTEKYISDILGGIARSAARGYREKYINFSRDDFKANCKGLGFPNEFQRLWLTEMTDPSSKYLINEEDGNPICLDGITFEIWNNGAFTTVFKW